MILNLLFTALRLSSSSSINLINIDSPVSLRDLVRNELLTNKALTNECTSVFKGQKDSKKTSRILDIILYGLKINNKSTRILEELRKL